MPNKIQYKPKFLILISLRRILIPFLTHNKNLDLVRGSVSAAMRRISIYLSLSLSLSMVRSLRKIQSYHQHSMDLNILVDNEKQFHCVKENSNANITIERWHVVIEGKKT